MRNAFLVSIIVIGSVGGARADEAAPPPMALTCKASSECPANSACSVEGVCVETTPAKPATLAVKVDAVVLKSGERVEGQVREQVRGQYVVIESNGAVRTLMWDSIAEVMVTKETEERLTKAAVAKPATIEAAAAATTGKSLKIGNKKSKKKVMKISTTTAFNANKEGAGLTYTKKCSKDGDPTCKETAALTVGREGPKASYSSEVDCSKVPGSDACTEKKSAGVSKAGFGVSYTKEELVAIDETKRPSKSTNFGMTGLVGFGGNTQFQIFVTNLDLNLKILTGGKKFPGKEGGNWVGFALEPTLGLVLQAITIKDPFGGTQSLSAAGVRGGSSAGLQLMHFGKMNDKTLKQRGIGVFLGVFGGYQSTSSTFMGMTTTTSSSSVGPQLNLIFPSYNAGTAKYKSSSLNFMILPTGDFVFVSVGFATVF